MKDTTRQAKPHQRGLDLKMNAINTVRDAASGPVETVRMSFGSGKTNTLGGIDPLEGTTKRRNGQNTKGFCR